jgi:hypothetical protein
MMDPVFTGLDSKNLSGFGVALDSVLDELPAHGEVVDLAPVFSEFVSRHHSNEKQRLISLFPSKFLNMAGEFLIGRRLDDFTPEDGLRPPVTSQEFLKAYDGGLYWMLVRVFFGAIGRKLPSKTFVKNCRLAHAFIDHYVRLAMEQKRATSRDPSSGEFTFKANQDFGMVGALTRESFDPREIRSQVLQCIMCMQGTTSALVNNTVWLLSRHPDAWESVRRDVAGRNLKDMTPKQFKDIEVLQNVLKESEYQQYISSFASCR